MDALAFVDALASDTGAMTPPSGAHPSATPASFLPVINISSLSLLGPT